MNGSKEYEFTYCPKCGQRMECRHTRWTAAGRDRYYYCTGLECEGRVTTREKIKPSTAHNQCDRNNVLVSGI